MIGILPTLHARALRDRVDERQPPLPGAQRGGVRRPRRGPRTWTSRGRRASAWRCTPTPSPPSPPAPRCSCTCRWRPQDFAAYWNAAQALAGPQLALGRELAVPLRQAAVGRDPHRAVPAGHRHPLGRAEEPGRAPAGVLRRALDHLDLRPVRGERPLLPGAAAGDHRRGPGGGAGRRARRRGCRSCGCTTAPSTAGTGRSTTSSTAARTCGWRTGCCRPGRPSSTCWPTPPSTTARCAMLAAEDRPVWTKMSFDAAEANFDAGARAGHRRACSTGPASARSPGDELVLRHLLPLAHEGLERWGVSAAVRDRYLGVDRGALQDRAQRRRRGRSRRSSGSRSAALTGDEALQRDARAATRGHARQRAGAHLGGALSRLAGGTCAAAARRLRAAVRPLSGRWSILSRTGHP